jgi:plastocyanin
MRTAVALTAATAVALAAAGCGGGGDSGGRTSTVLKPGDVIGMKSLKFAPDHAQVAAGQRITWRNLESIPHDVKADRGARFASSTFGKGGTFTWTPSTAGTVTYECTLHPGMTGTIDVVAR